MVIGISGILLQWDQKKSDKDDANEVIEVSLSGVENGMAEMVKVVNYCSFYVDDHDDCFYVVRWTGLPYTLEEEIPLHEYDPPITIKEGEIACDASHFINIPHAKYWYNHPKKK